jgi:hypothetical protein
MKTTIEINGYQILISEEKGKVIVSATKDDDVVEEFTLELEEQKNMKDSDIEDEKMIPFDGEEEEDFDEEYEDDEDEDEYGDEDDDEDNDEDDDEDEYGDEDDDEDDDEDEGKLESFRSFIKKRK